MRPVITKFTATVVLVTGLCGWGKVLADPLQSSTLTLIESQYNSSSWAAANLLDNNASTRWLSNDQTNDLNFQLTSGSDDVCFNGFGLTNYGNDDRSVSRFMLLTASNLSLNVDSGTTGWTPVVSNISPTGNLDYVSWAQGGRFVSIDSEYNSTTWAAANIHDGDQNTRWLSSKQTNTLTFAFDTDFNGSTGDSVNLDNVSLTNYGTDDRSVQTFEIDIQISGGAWQTINAPGGGTVFTASMNSTEQNWSVGPFSNVTAARFRSLTNYGDPSYTGARELVFSGNSVGPSYTYTAAMHGNGESFTIDVANQPQNVTDVRLRTINNHGDPSYIGAKEFEVLGDSVTIGTIFEAAMHGNGETFVLDKKDQPKNVTDVRLVTISNHGDPSYTGAKEFKLLGSSVTRTKTFTAAMHGNGETFTLDNNDIPKGVTEVKLITINNHGDPSYIGLKEFEVLGDSIGPSHTFSLAMSSSVQTITLDSADAVTGVVGARLITIKNHGDPSYTGMAEFRLKGAPVASSYVFDAQMATGLQNFNFSGASGKVLRFHSLTNHGDGSYTGATDFSLTSSSCGGTPTVHHFEISHDGSALTCAADTLTIKACADNGCTMVMSDDIDVTLSATGGASTWSQNPLTIPGNSSSGVTVELTHSTAETVTLGATSTPAPSSTTVCSPNCDLTFEATGYQLTLPNSQSCAANTLTIKAVKLSDTGVSCAPAYSGNQTVGFSFNYANPSTGTHVPTLVSASMAAAGVVQNRTVNFDGAGTASLAFSYADAGQISVNVSDAGNAGLASSSVTGVVTPAKLIVASNDTNADCSSGDASCSVFKSAGSAFNLTVSGACADNSLTPNFAMNSIPLTVNTVAPTTGNPVSLAVTTVSVDSADNGSHTISNQSISEVGVFTITATPATNGYFGTTIASATSANIGRFTPASFDLATSVDGVLTSGNSFVYTGQMDAVSPTKGKIFYSIAPKFTITPKSSVGATLLNYTGSFAKLQVADVVRQIPSSDATKLGADNTNKLNITANLDSGSLTESNSVLSYQFASTDRFVYTREANALVAPFTADIDFQVNSITDDDGIVASDTDGNSSNGVLTLNPIGLEVRFGRWFVENSHGGEADNLFVPMKIQYFDGSAFGTNTSDSFTTFDASGDSTIVDIDLAPASTSAFGSGTFSAGQTNDVGLLAPNSGGSVKLMFTAPAWLQYDWDNSDGQLDGPYDDNPYSTVTFGVFRGNDRVINWREKR